MTSDSSDRLVAFQTKNEEHARKILKEAQRLANLAPGEWRVWIDKSCTLLGVARTDFEPLVKDIISAKEKAEKDRKAEERQQEKRIKEERAEAERAERKREREQQRIDKEAEQKRKDKEKAFEKLLKLPCVRLASLSWPHSLAKILRRCARSSKPSLAAG